MSNLQLNKYQATGRLTRDPELRHTPGGKAVVKFGLAANRSYKKADGSYDQETCFLDCEAWDTGAEAIAKGFESGDPIYIEGSLKTDTWEDKQTGQKRSSIKVRVTQFAWMESKEEKATRKAKKDQGGGQSRSARGRQQETQPTGGGYDENGGNDGEIPF